MLNALRNLPTETPMGDPIEPPAGAACAGVPLGALERVALARRPELARMRAMRREQEAMAALARRERYPDVMTSVWHNQMLGGPDTTGLMLGVSLPVFGLARQARLAASWDRSASGAGSELTAMQTLTLGLVFVILYLNLRGVAQTLIVMLGVPFAAVGAIWLLYFAAFNTSIAVWVGMIAPLGVAAETTSVMIVYLDDAWNEGRRSGRIVDVPSLIRASVDAGSQRVRPLLMTVMTNIFGLLPVLIDTGVGADVAKRIAAPMWGGLISLTLLTLEGPPHRAHCGKYRPLPNHRHDDATWCGETLAFRSLRCSGTARARCLRPDQHRRHRLLRPVAPLPAAPLRFRTPDAA